METPRAPQNEGTKGVLYAISAFTLWGVLPIFWKELHHVPTLLVIGHRVVWCVVLLVCLLATARDWRWVPRSWKGLRTYIFSGLMLATNWMIFVWAVTHGRVVETSLGYFINPLFSVLLGRIVLQETLTRLQGVAVAVAGFGVVWIGFGVGTIPWIALSLATTFGMYSLLRKQASLSATQGLAVEMTVLLPAALGVLLWHRLDGQAAFTLHDMRTNVFLVGAGVVTAVPLLFFAGAARRLRLGTLGLIQYLAPSLQLMVGVFVFGEAFGLHRGIGFAMIWCALALYSQQGMAGMKKPRPDAR